MPLSRLMGARTRTRFASLVLSVSLVLGLFGGLFGLVEVTPAGAAGAPTQLAYTTNPSTVAAGAAMTAPVVQLRDSGNNNVLQSGTSVSVAINSGPGSFDPSATTTTTTNSSGQAIFSNLVFDTTGSYTLIATSSGLTSKVSGSFNVDRARPRSWPCPTFPPLWCRARRSGHHRHRPGCRGQHRDHTQHRERLVDGGHRPAGWSAGRDDHSQLLRRRCHLLRGDPHHSG